VETPPLRRTGLADHSYRIGIRNKCVSQISKTTPCKVAGGGQHSTKQFDTSGKSGAFFHYSEILYATVAPQ
jgi:hypothetical protein